MQGERLKISHRRDNVLACIVSIILRSQSWCITPPLHSVTPVSLPPSQRSNALTLSCSGSSPFSPFPPDTLTLFCSGSSGSRRHC